MSASESLRVGVVSNPHALKNRSTSGPRPVVSSVLGGRADIIETNSTADISDAVQTHIANKAKVLVADGGDGAMHWLLNKSVALLGEENVQEQLIFVPAAGGTIDFMALALGWKNDTATILRGIRGWLDGEETARLVKLPSMVATLRRTDGTEERRYAYSAALGGYAGNFYGPFYRSYRLRGPVRIVGLLTEAFGAAAFGSAFRGPLSRFKPNRIAELEHAYLRPVLGEVLVDGKPAPGRPAENGAHEYTLVQAGSVHVNLGGVIKVFGEATDGCFHAQVGHLSPGQALPALTKVARNKPIDMPGIHDGTASRLEVLPSERGTLVPCLDGELTDDIDSVELRAGPVFSFLAAP